MYIYIYIYIYIVAELVLGEARTITNKIVYSNRYTNI